MVYPRQDADVFQVDLGHYRKVRGKKHWNSACMAVCWTIWLERNRRIFKPVQEDVDYLWESEVLVAPWIDDTKKNSNVYCLWIC